MNAQPVIAMGWIVFVGITLISVLVVAGVLGVWFWARRGGPRGGDE